MMDNVLVIGGSGVLGSALVNLLQRNHITYLIGSRNQIKPESYSNVNQSIELPWMRIDLTTGEGLAEALTNVDTVFHLASGQGKLGREPFDLAITRNLLQAVEKSAVKQLIYSSVVGVDKISLPYHRAKYESELLLQRSRVPTKILRATQFHDLVDFWLSKLVSLPVGFVPERVLLQPIQVSAVAYAL